jgi:hypothetical protein
MATSTVMPMQGTILSGEQMSFLRRIFTWLYLLPFRLYLKSDTDHRYFGPVLGSDLDAEKFAQLHQYRMNFYQLHLPYLSPTNSAALQNEVSKDLRSHQMWAEDENGNIVGSCMFTPYPFEMSPALTKEINETHKNHMEISRLLVIKQRRGIGMRLLFQGCPLVVSGALRGVIGICKPMRLSMFSLVGMKVVGEVTLKERNHQNYKIISASVWRLTFMMNLIAIKALLLNADGNSQYARYAFRSIAIATLIFAVQAISH